METKPLKRALVKYDKHGGNQYQRLPLEKKNENILRVLAEMGVSAFSLARQIGMQPTTLYDLINRKILPVSRDPDGLRWSTHAKTLAFGMGVDPSELWPEVVRHVEPQFTTVEVARFPRLRSSAREIARLLKKSLPEFWATVMVLRFGLGDSAPMTIRSIAQHLNVTYSSVLVTESAAIRGIRSLPNVIRALVEIRDEIRNARTTRRVARSHPWKYLHEDWQYNGGLDDDEL